MKLVSLRCWNFRNLASDPVHWVEGTNLIVGANGEGKTSLLEAVAVLGNLRSFRTRSMGRVVCHGEGSFGLDGEVWSGGSSTRLQQVVEIGPPLRRTLKVNGAVVGPAQYLSIFPVFAITPADSELVAGEPAVRRAFLDRFAFLLGPEVYDQLRDYRRALRQRNAALEGADDQQMDVWEEALARAAAVVMGFRRRAVARVAEAFGPIYTELRGPSFPDVALAYRCEGWLEADTALGAIEQQYGDRYRAVRDRDRRVGFTADGPHRHDLAIRAEGRGVRHVLSSGQLKVVASALRLAALSQVETERSTRLPVMIDDVDSQLDPQTMGRLAALIGVERQVFLSSANSDLVTRTVEASSELWMRQGSCIHAVSGGEIA